MLLAKNTRTHKPLVGLSWESKFNESLALDLSKLEGRRFIVMVNQVTTYCQAYWVKDKTPETIMDILMTG